MAADPKDVAEIVRQLNQLADKGNWGLAKLEELGVRFDPTKPVDLRAVVAVTPDLLQALGGFLKG